MHLIQGRNSVAEYRLTIGNTASFEEILLQWQSVGNTVSDMTGPRFEPQTSHTRDKHITALI